MNMIQVYLSRFYYINVFFRIPGINLAGGVLLVNAIGTQLHDLINLGLGRRRMTVPMETVVRWGMDAWSPVRQHQIQAKVGK